MSLFKTLAHHAGFLEIDHRDSPGLRPEDVAHVPGAIPVGQGQVLERDVKQCSHCQRAVVLNPGRVRDRAVCPKCYHYICDECEAIRVKSGDCVPWAKVMDVAYEQLVTGKLETPAVAQPLRDELGGPAGPPSRVILTDPAEERQHGTLGSRVSDVDADRGGGHDQHDGRGTPHDPGRVDDAAR